MKPAWKSALWTKALQSSAEPQRAKHHLELFAAVADPALLQKPSPEQARVCAALFAGSAALSSLLVAHPAWAGVLDVEGLRYARRKTGLRQELDQAAKPLLASGDYQPALARVREFKQRALLRVGARDLARLGRLEEILQEISDIADVTLEGVWQVCLAQLVARYGLPCHRDLNGVWRPTPACVLGMGKLGGQELNYSSDVDVLFVYSDEGEVYATLPTGAAAKTPRRASPRAVMPNHQFFKKLAEAFIGEVARLAPEGSLYRIDLRLRPEGEGGPLSRSLASYENYYAQWGQTWERMMLIKARGVAGDEAVAAEFLEMVQPFRYPRSISEGVLGEIGAMKDRIENEVVKTGELERNVKLGRGGIREIEFVAQSMQLLHAGKQPFLQGAQTLPCLDKLVQYELLSAADSRALRQAYVFLREVEHRLQMDDNRQTHTIPDDRRAQERLARLMAHKSLRDFEAARREHTANVRRIFDSILKAEIPAAGGPAHLPRSLAGDETEWKSVLESHGFKDVDKALRVLREFVEGPGFVHVSARTKELALQLLPRLFALCRKQPPGANNPVRGGEPALREKHVPLSDPDRVITRLDSFISAYGARATLFELWASNPGIFELLVLLFDRSEFLAELAIRTPDLVDELVTSGRLRQRKQTEETLRDLRHGLADPDQHLWMRRYHQAELMRIGLRDILGLADAEQYLTELSALADACLRYALEVVMRKHRLKQPPFAIVGLGKLGGQEIDYGSDLDIVFVADTKSKSLAQVSRLAVELMDLVSRRTEQGVLFHTDARLRPDGEKGLLTNTLKAYEEYYRQRAQLWEIQTLTRTRVVAGDGKVGEQFQRLAAKLTNFAHPDLPLVAWSPEWKEKIHRMRMRIEKERTPLGQDELAIKTGSGGLMDAEFVAQALCLEHGWQEPNTLRALEKGRGAGVLPLAAQLIDNYRQLRRMEAILRRWSYEGETVLPVDPAPYYRVSVRCGFDSPEAFRQALNAWRRAIREGYLQVFA